MTTEIEREWQARVLIWKRRLILFVEIAIGLALGLLIGQCAGHFLDNPFPY